MSESDLVKVKQKIMNPVTGEADSQLIGTDISMRSTDDIEWFCEENHIEIDYADGYGAELFVTNWKTYIESLNQYVPRTDTPVLVPEAWLGQYGLEYGQHIDIYASSGKTNINLLFHFNHISHISMQILHIIARPKPVQHVLRKICATKSRHMGRWMHRAAPEKQRNKVMKMKSV